MSQTFLSVLAEIESDPVEIGSLGAANDDAKQSPVVF